MPITNHSILYPPIVSNKELYEDVRRYADKIYKHPSAYKSMYIQKLYKRLGGTYKDDGKERKLLRWINEHWEDISNKKSPHYPVYRPTVKVSEDTPLLVNEIDKNDLKKKIEQKQLIKGFKNLTPFKHK